jgi:hypothetical protein
MMSQLCSASFDSSTTMVQNLIKDIALDIAKTVVATSSWMRAT